MEEHMLDPVVAHPVKVKASRPVSKIADLNRHLTAGSVFVPEQADSSLNGFKRLADVFSKRVGHAECTERMFPSMGSKAIP